MSEDIFTHTEQVPPVSRIENLVEKYRIPLILTSLGFVALAIALVFIFQNNSKKVEIIEAQKIESKDNPATTSNQIKIDVSGGVLIPGVYEVSPDSRVKDVLVLAGGLSDEADRDWFDKTINQAAPLKDGQKVYIKKILKSVPNQISNSNLDSQGSVGEVAGDSLQLVNINTASSGDLEKLPGIGPVTTQKIINGRPYGAIEELLTKKIVGKSVFEKIKEGISIY